MRCFFPKVSFQIFFFVLSFQKFDLMCLVDFLRLTSLGFAQHLESICFWQVWGIFSHYFFKYLFTYALNIFSLQDFDNTNVRCFCYSPTGVWASINNFRLLSFCHSNWVISMVLSSTSPIFFSFVPSFCYEPIHWVFNFLLLCISVLNFPFGLLRLSIYFLWDFLICLKCICSCC